MSKDAEDRIHLVEFGFPAYTVAVNAARGSPAYARVGMDADGLDYLERELVRARAILEAGTQGLSVRPNTQPGEEAS